MGKACSDSHSPKNRAPERQMGQRAYQLARAGREVRCLSGRSVPLRAHTEAQVGLIVVHRPIPMTALAPPDVNVTNL